MICWRRTMNMMAGASTCLLAAGGAGAEGVPDAATLLFEHPQLAHTAPGDVIGYSYRRTSADPVVFGPSLNDHIRLEVGAGASPDTRTVDVQMFSGANQRMAGPFSDMSGNPILSLILEQSVQGLSTRLKANPRYLKNTIRAAFRDEAQVTPDRVGEPGKTSPGWRVAITPFKNDPNRGRMAGLEGLTYTFRVGEGVPGEIYEIDIAATDGSGKTLLEEKVDYVPTLP